MDLWNGETEGLITYMRTDSVNLSELAKTQAKDEILKLFGKEYHKSRDFVTKTAGAQEAHEAIRPTDISRTPESLKKCTRCSTIKIIYTYLEKNTSFSDERCYSGSYNF